MSNCDQKTPLLLSQLTSLILVNNVLIIFKNQNDFKGQLFAPTEPFTFSYTAESVHQWFI